MGTDPVDTMGSTRTTGAFAWALVACAALVALPGAALSEVAEHPAVADISATGQPAAAVDESPELGSTLAIAKKSSGMWEATIVGPQSLVASICPSWAKAGKCATSSKSTTPEEVAFMKKHCASACAANRPPE